MKKRSTETIGSILCRSAVAGFVLTIGGCRSCLPQQTPNVITPAALNSIAINAGFRETNWTTLDPCEDWESPVQYEQVDEDWYLYQSSETSSNTLEQVQHEVPGELANIENASIAQEHDHIEQGTGKVETCSGSVSNPLKDLKPVKIECLR